MRCCLFGQVAQDQSVHYASLGDWSTHDLLFFILEQTGPAKVYFTTWAISEYAIRQLYLFIEQGLILELKGIFDYRNGIRKPAELQFLQKITTDIKAAKCHAKVTVIMEVSPQELSELPGDSQSPAFRAFHRGRLKRDAELTWRC
jgi:hypothetical protein